MECIRKSNIWVRGRSEASLATFISLVAKEVGINKEGCKSCKINNLGVGNKHGG